MLNRAIFSLIVSLISLSAGRTLAATPCPMTAVGGRDLIHGASRQRLVLKASSCKGFDLKRIYKLNLKDISILATPAGTSTLDEIQLNLEFDNGSPEITSSAVMFDVQDDAGASLGSVALRVIDIAITSTTVTYYDSELDVSRSQVNRRAPAPPTGSGLPIAVANPLSDYANQMRASTAERDMMRVNEAVQAAKSRIINRAVLSVPTSFTEVPGLEWQVSALSPKLEFQGKEGDGQGGKILASPPEIPYVVQGQQAGRVRARLSLRKGPNEYLAIDLDLADSAKIGLGQPLRIADLVRVVCGGKGAGHADVAANGVTHAISGNEMARGRCFLYFDPCNQEALSRDKTSDQQIVGLASDPEGLQTIRIRTKYNLYGPQNIVVSVDRNGVSGRWEQSFVVEPSTWSCRKADGNNQSDEEGRPRPDGLQFRPAFDLGLKTPQGDQGGGEELYSIHVRTATRVPVVEYADDVQAPIIAGIEHMSPEYQFEARLRPSGPFGLPYKHGGHFDGYSARIFVTIPIEGVSVRFPTSVPDLKSTSDNTSVQVMTLRAGALLTFEPWDYNRGTNFIAIPLRFQVGGHLVDLGKGSFAPSFLAGMSANFPLIDSAPKFAQSSVGIGAFYELDGRDRSSHFLLSVGLNLLSLFSPPAGSSH